MNSSMRHLDYQVQLNPLYMLLLLSQFKAMVLNLLVCTPSYFTTDSYVINLSPLSLGGNCDPRNDHRLKLSA